MPIFPLFAAVCGLCDWEENYDHEIQAEKGLADHQQECNLRAPVDCSCPEPRNGTFVSTGYQGTVYKHEPCGLYYVGPTYKPCRAHIATCDGSGPNCIKEAKE